MILNKNIGSLPIWQFALVMVSIVVALGFVGNWMKRKSTEPKI